MRILWDFRLFSFGYASRGVGTYALRMAEAILREHSSDIFVIWADKNCLPAHTKDWPVVWIPYKKKTSWKHDFFSIPLLLVEYRIDIIHYWVALGPIHSIGMTAFHQCASVATVYDMAVELWDDVPFAASKKNTMYWKIQKQCIRQCRHVFCISKATESDLCHVINKKDLNTSTIYLPATSGDLAVSTKRKPYFIALGGSPHKNLRRVVAAFSKMKHLYNACELFLLGDIDKEVELPDALPDGLHFEDMSQYRYHLHHASGLIVCSLHEGLGLPVLDAMSSGCPLLLADIPSLHEIGDGAAVFVDPYDISGIAHGMQEIFDNQEILIVKSAEGMRRYAEKSEGAGKEMIGIYHTCKQKT